ncbi:adenosylmethionine-8-amino-7-oxononanoate aminotransferase [Mesorhizobium shonense]|uniref:Adenosylmethionine-8-amino-7-oxononanoate aminotransferase n=1 Tax=Mesorhizobium shonense TaxID=1209948 RepID=A0ABV2HXF8_9HYPH
MSHMLPFTDPRSAEGRNPKTMVSGRGCHVTDTEGNEYLDAVAGLWCASLGFSNERLVEAASKQLSTLPYYHSFLGRTAAVTDALARKLTEKLPVGMTKIFFGSSGSEAVDTAVKLTHFYQNARGKPEKKRVVARQGAYHGSGALSAGLTGLDYCHIGFDLPGAMVLRTGRPHYFGDAEPGESETAFSRRRARELDALIVEAGPESVAAFIGEPVMGSGGVVPPPDGYWEAVQEVLARHDVLLIADEVITGFGRTGSWFASQRYGLRPAMLTMAKQMTGAYFPMSALALESNVAEVIEKHAHELGTLGHGFTYGGHPVGAAVALEAVRIYEEMDLPNHVADRSNALNAALAPIKANPRVGNVRVIGLMAGVELVDGRDPATKLARRVADEAERRGVLFRVIGPILGISPPYVVSDAEVELIGRTLVESLDAAVRAEGY